MTKATKAPKPTAKLLPSSKTATGNSKKGFWIPDALYERIQTYVSHHRNAPENMTINKFVREALSLKLSAVERKAARA